MRGFFKGLGIVIVAPILLIICLGWGLFCAVILRGIDAQILEET